MCIRDRYPGYVMTLGSAGISVRRLQRYMNAIAARYCFAGFVPDTGIFDEQTVYAVQPVSYTHLPAFWPPWPSNS